MPWIELTVDWSKVQVLQGPPFKLWSIPVTWFTPYSGHMKNRVARLMRLNEIRGIKGFKRPRPLLGKPSLLMPNQLQRQFSVSHPDEAWVTDITYIRTRQGWLYLAVVIALFARKVVGWSMKPTLAKEVILDALLMAVWRRRHSYLGDVSPEAFEQASKCTGAVSV